MEGLRDSRLRVLELRSRDFGKALALNFGLAQAKGDVIAQFDADKRIPDKQLLRRAVAYCITEPATDVLQAQIETQNERATRLPPLQAVQQRNRPRLGW